MIADNKLNKTTLKKNPQVFIQTHKVLLKKSKHQSRVERETELGNSSMGCNHI